MRRTTGWLGAISLLVATAACGSDDSGGNGTSASTGGAATVASGEVATNTGAATTATGQVPTNTGAATTAVGTDVATDASVVKFGLVCDCSGGSLSSSDAVAEPIIKTWEAQVNANGGLAGHKVEVIYKDPNYNNGTALSMVQSLIREDEVSAIFIASATADSWGTYAQEQGVPVIGINDSYSSFATNDHFFATGETIDYYLTNWVLAAQEVDAKSVGLFYCAEAAVCKQTVEPFQSTAKELGVEVKYVGAVSASAPDYTAPCLAAKDAGVEALVIASAAATTATIAAACDQQDYHPWYIALDGAVANLYTKTPGISSKFIGSQPNYPWFLDDLPAMKSMIGAIEKYQPDLLNDPNYGGMVVSGWAAGLLVEAAVTAAGVAASDDVTPDVIKTGLYAQVDQTLGGLAPPLNYKAGQANPVRCFYWIKMTEGVFTAPEPHEPVCAPGAQ